VLHIASFALSAIVVETIMDYFHIPTQATSNVVGGEWVIAKKSV